MRVLLRYQLEFLVRSRRWLPPVLTYALVMTVGVSSGQPLPDSFGFGAAVLVPVTAWLTRSCLTAEPAAARACVEAAAGAVRVHLAQLLAALTAGAVLAVLGVAGVLALGGPAGRAGPVPAVAAGLLAGLVAVLTGLGVGALCNRPLVRSPATAILLSLAASLGLLVADGSPVNAALRPLMYGGRVELPLAASAGGLTFAAGAVGVALLAGRRVGQ